MEFEPGHTAFSYPRRPCRLDRSFSWTGTTKSSYNDLLGSSGSQYALTDLDCDYGYHNGAMDFLDVPSMFEDALRQLASTPCFALSPIPPQAGSPLAATIPETQPQQGVETEIDTQHLDISNDEGFLDNTVTLGEFEQDFSSNQWLIPLANNYTVSGSPMDSSAGQSDATPSFPGLQIDQTDGFLFPSCVTTRTDQSTSLETIDEEVDFSVGNMAQHELNLIFRENITGTEAYHSQGLSLNMSVHTIADQEPMFSPIDESMLWQSLVPSSNNEAFMFSPATQDSQADEPSAVLAKVDLEIRVDCHKPAEVPLPLNDLISKFDSNPGASPPKRKRRCFTADGKTKVKGVRETGACVFCRARKVSCTPKGACTACIKLACSAVLADHICVRSRLRDTFVGVRALHGSSFDHRKARLEPLLSSLTGQPRPIQFSVESYDDHDSVPFRNNDHHIRTLASLDIQVMQCSSSALCRWKKLTKVSGIYITSDIFDGRRYVIVPSSLPTIDEFDRFGRRILLASDGGHSGQITLLLDEFLAIYCSTDNKTELRTLANLTSRIASLNNLVAYGFLNLRDGSYDLLETSPPGTYHNEKYISETVHDQIRLLAAEGLEPAENIVFRELDNINKYVGASEHARMIIGVCIMRLMLLYRDRLVRDDIRLSLPRQKKWHQYRLERASFMYRRLTVAYSTICREYDTPLTMEWRDENDNGLFEGDQMLKSIYIQLQPAFRQFCNDKLTLQYDDVLKVLLADPAKQHKSKKRRKISR